MKHQDGDIVLGPAVISQTPKFALAVASLIASFSPSSIPLIGAPALSMFGLGPDINLRAVSGVLLLIAAILLFRAAVTLYFNEYRITESKVIQKWGIPPHYRAIKLKDIRITTTVRVPLISLGSVKITTSGNGKDDILLSSLRHPRKVKALIDNAEQQWWKREDKGAVDT